MYRVWYWLGGKLQRQLEMVNCGKDYGLAVRIFTSYNALPSYDAWLEYEADIKVAI